jgi:hypothetical protein
MRRLAAIGSLLAGVSLLIPATAGAGTFTLTNATAGIFDASSGTRSVVVTGAEAGFDGGILVALTISIDYTKADGEDLDPPASPGTPFYNEIHFRLDRAAEPSTTLIAAGHYTTGSGVFSGIQTFVTGGAVIPFGSSPVAGTFSPTGPGSLTAYNGLSILGTWTLFIQDTVGLDALRFRSVSFTFETGAAVPEPVTSALVGSGLLGLAYRRRRRNAR